MCVISEQRARHLRRRQRRRRRVLARSGVQSSQQEIFATAQASAIRAFGRPLPEVMGPDGTLPRIAGIETGSTRVIREVIQTGESPTVESD